MQYSAILSILAGAAAVSAGLTDSLIPSSLTGTANGDADAQAKCALSGLPTDDLLSSGLTGDAKKAIPESADDSTDASADSKAALADSGLLGSLGLKALRNPVEYPYEDPSTTYYSARPTPTTIVRVVTFTATAPAPTGTTVVNGVASCSEGTATSCCDTKAASDGFLSNILGGSCALSNLQIPVLAIGALGGSQCNQENTFCCPINQDGNLNIALACIPLNL